ncbi:MAG TPA: hypothetical protein VGJ92_13945 [Methanocella sp.]|jgi:hypothetical protein
MEGYQSAENAALAVNGDAVFTGVVGYKLKNTADEQIIIDGKATRWSYVFASLSAEKEILVKVYGDGSINISELKINSTKMPDELGQFQGIHPVSDWKIDSTMAAQRALPIFKEKYGTDAIAAIYCLVNYRNRNTGNLDFYWWITLQGRPTGAAGEATTYVPPVNVYIDPMTGALLPEQIPVPGLPVQ